MYKVTPYVDHNSTTTEFVAPHPSSSGGGESRLRFQAPSTTRCVRSTVSASDGSWHMEVEWPDIIKEHMTLPPSYGTWRRHQGAWVAHDPTDPAQAALLVQVVPDPPAVTNKQLQARVTFVEAALAKLSGG